MPWHCHIAESKDGIVDDEWEVTLMSQRDGAQLGIPNHTNGERLDCQVHNFEWY